MGIVEDCRKELNEHLEDAHFGVRFLKNLLGARFVYLSERPVREGSKITWGKFPENFKKEDVLKNYYSRGIDFWIEYDPGENCPLGSRYELDCPFSVCGIEGQLSKIWDELYALENTYKPFVEDLERKPILRKIAEGLWKERVDNGK